MDEVFSTWSFAIMFCWFNRSSSLEHEGNFWDVSEGFVELQFVHRVDLKTSAVGDTGVMLLGFKNGVGEWGVVYGPIRTAQPVYHPKFEPVAHESEGRQLQVQVSFTTRVTSSNFADCYKNAWKCPHVIHGRFWLVEYSWWLQPRDCPIAIYPKCQCSLCTCSLQVGIGGSSQFPVHSLLYSRVRPCKCGQWTRLLRWRSTPTRECRAPQLSHIHLNPHCFWFNL